MASWLERRRSDRVKVMFSAVVEQEGQARAARLANLSSNGALVIGSRFRHGAPIRLQRNGTEVCGSVTWSEGDLCGVKFDGAVDVTTTLRTIPQPRRVNQAPARRPGFKCAPMSEAERASFDRWLNTGPRLVVG